MKPIRLGILTLTVLTLIQLASCAKSTEDNAEVATAHQYISDNSKNTLASESFDGYGAELYEYEYRTQAATEEAIQNDLAERKIIKTAYVNFETKAYDEFSAGISECIRKYGGYTQSEESFGGSTYSRYSMRSSTISVRIPLETYDAFMAEACEIGSVTYKSESSSDVTMQYVDTESHIRALETEYNALISILEKAEKLEDVVTLQSRISEVTYQLESYKSQLRKYDDLIAYCTVNINISEVERETPNENEMTFADKITSGLSDTFDDIAENASNFAIWFITSLPYIVIWAAILTAAVIIVKKVILKSVKKMKKKKTDNANEEKED